MAPYDAEVGRITPIPDVTTQRKTTLCIAGIYGLLAAVALYPASLSPFRLIAGSSYTDTGQHLWLIWWPIEALLRGTSPLYTTLLNFPQGGSFYPLDLPNTLISAPLQLLGRLIGYPLLAPAYNFALAADLVLAALAAYFLVLHLAHDRGAAFVAGAIYGFSPYMISSVQNGLSEIMNLAYYPLFLLAFFLVQESPTPRRAFLAGGAFFLSCLANWYSCAVTLLTLPIYFLYILPARRREITVKHLRAYALAIVAGALMLAPFALAFRAHLASPHGLMNPVQRMAKTDLNKVFTSPLAGYVTPGKIEVSPLGPYYHITYLGGGTLLIILLTGGFLRRTGLFWTAVACVFLVISLGPFLSLTHPGQVLKPEGRDFFLPYYHMAKHLPWFDRLNFPCRFVAPATLCLSVLAGLGLAPLLDRLKPRKGMIFSGLIGLLLFSETLLISPAPFPAETFPGAAPAPLVALGKERGNFGVLDVPLLASTLPTFETHGDFRNIAKGTWGRYFYYATIHRKGTPYLIENEVPGIWKTNPLLKEILKGSKGRLPDPLICGENLALLRSLGFRCFILHWDFLAPESRALLNELPGVTRNLLGNIIIYDFSRPSSRAGSKETLRGGK
jgi:hypothetical protein